MKKSLLFVVFTLIFLISCEKDNRDIFFRIGPPNFEFKFSDIELYDTSTHIIYFKNEYDDLKNLDQGGFTFLDNGDPIYSGSLWPGYSSLGPSDPFIMTPPMYGNYALRIGSWHFDKPDLRNDPRLIQLLNQHNILHSGLAISDISIEIVGAQLSFRFSISNQDISDLLILDLNKTGLNLFHYFTNGLYIYDFSNNEVFSSTIQHQVPNPWDVWKIEWLTELKSGESKEFTINYPLNNPLPAGEYSARFEFPGLGNQVTKEQLYQGNIRIWLGDVSIKKQILIP
jgi:hypothetical protein